jgi:hypothetical protein
MIGSSQPTDAASLLPACGVTLVADAPIISAGLFLRLPMPVWKALELASRNCLSSSCSPGSVVEGSASGPRRRVEIVSRNASSDGTILGSVARAQMRMIEDQPTNAMHRWIWRRTDH